MMRLMRKYYFLFISLCLLANNALAVEDYNEEFYKDLKGKWQSPGTVAFIEDGGLKYLASPEILSIKEAYSVVSDYNTNKTMGKTNLILLTAFENGVLATVSYRFIDEMLALDIKERKKYAEKGKDIIDCIYRPKTAYHNIIFREFEEGKPVGDIMYGVALYREALKCLKSKG